MHQRYLMYILRGLYYALLNGSFLHQICIYLFFAFWILPSVLKRRSELLSKSSNMKYIANLIKLLMYNKDNYIFQLQELVLLFLYLASGCRMIFIINRNIKSWFFYIVRLKIILQYKQLIAVINLSLFIFYQK